MHLKNQMHFRHEEWIVILSQYMANGEEIIS